MLPLVMRLSSTYLSYSSATFKTLLHSSELWGISDLHSIEQYIFVLPLLFSSTGNLLPQTGHTPFSTFLLRNTVKGRTDFFFLSGGLFHISPSTLSFRSSDESLIERFADVNGDLHNLEKIVKLHITRSDIYFEGKEEQPVHRIPVKFFPFNGAVPRHFILYFFHRKELIAQLQGIVKRILISENNAWEGEQEAATSEHVLFNVNKNHYNREQNLFRVNKVLFKANSKRTKPLKMFVFSLFRMVVL